MTPVLLLMVAVAHATRPYDVQINGRRFVEALPALDMPEDINGDGLRDKRDLKYFFRFLGANPLMATWRVCRYDGERWRLGGDLDCDNDCDLADYAVLQRRWGKPAGARAGPGR